MDKKLAAKQFDYMDKLLEEEISYYDYLINSNFVEYFLKLFDASMWHQCATLIEFGTLKHPNELEVKGYYHFVPFMTDSEILELIKDGKMWNKAGSFKMEEEFLIVSLNKSRNHSASYKISLSKMKARILQKNLRLRISMKFIKWMGYLLEFWLLLYCYVSQKGAIKTLFQLSSFHLLFSLFTKFMGLLMVWSILHFIFSNFISTIEESTEEASKIEDAKKKLPQPHVMMLEYFYKGEIEAAINY